MSSTILGNATPYSPVTTLSADFNIAAVQATVTSIAAFGTAPIYVVLTAASNIGFASNDPAHYETILVEGISGNNLTTITRAIEGTEQDWVIGDFIAAFFTAKAWNNMQTQKANTIHNLVDTTNHPVSGLTEHHVLKATGATAYAFGALPNHNLVDTTNHPVTGLTTGHLLKATGATAYAFGASDDLPLAGGTMSGDITMADRLIIQPDIKDYCETLATATWNGATHSIDLTAGNVHSISITAAVTTLTFTNPRAGAHSFTLRLAQGGTLRAVAWPASVSWAGGSAPTMAINKVYWITFATVNSGTAWHGFLAGEV